VASAIEFVFVALDADENPMAPAALAAQRFDNNAGFINRAIHDA
jgi:hypothetical protein